MYLLTVMLSLQQTTFNIVTYKMHEITLISPFNKSNYLLLKYKIYQYYINKFPSVCSVNYIIIAIALSIRKPIK